MFYYGQVEKHNEWHKYKLFPLDTYGAKYLKFIFKITASCEIFIFKMAFQTIAIKIEMEICQRL